MNGLFFLALLGLVLVAMVARWAIEMQEHEDAQPPVDAELERVAHIEDARRAVQAARHDVMRAFERRGPRV